MLVRIRQAFVACLDLLLPPACLLCGRQLTPEGENDFCTACFIGMPSAEVSCCPRCAHPHPPGTSSHLCGNCLRRPPNFSRVHASGPYRDKTRDAVQRLKYHGQLSLAGPLGRRLAGIVRGTAQDFTPHCIVPVPLHPRRLRQRGFNQALEIARPVARQLGVPLRTHLLERTRNTPPQQELSAAARSTNLRGAFALAEDACGMHILLIDDVMTTGETARECCRVLCTGGAGEVRVAVVGRA